MKAFWFLPGLALAGCSVYSPTAPSTPLVEKGEVEFTAALRGCAAEVSGAWAPAAGVLVTGEAASRAYPNNASDPEASAQRFNEHRQAGLGLGTYRVLGTDAPVYLAAVGGIGFAKANVYDAAILSSYHHYEASYTRYYGQVYAGWREQNRTYGVSMRGTWVDYQHLLMDGQPTTASRARFYLEPSAFMRVGSGPVQFLSTVGLSLPTLIRNDQFGASTLSPVSWLFSAGVVLRPQLFGKR